MLQKSGSFERNGRGILEDHSPGKAGSLIVICNVTSISVVCTDIISLNSIFPLFSLPLFLLGPLLSYGHPLKVVYPLCGHFWCNWRVVVRGQWEGTGSVYFGHLYHNHGGLLGHLHGTAGRILHAVPGTAHFSLHFQSFVHFKSLAWYTGICMSWSERCLNVFVNALYAVFSSLFLPETCWVLNTKSRAWKESICVFIENRSHIWYLIYIYIYIPSLMSHSVSLFYLPF